MTAQQEAKRLIEDRAKVQDEMKTIHLRADDKGNLSADDQAKWDELSKRDDDLKSQSTRIVRMAEFEAEAAKREAEKLPPSNKEEKSEEADKKEFKAAWGRFLRAHGDNRRVSQADMDIIKRGTDSQVAGTDALGGYLVPDGFAGQLEKYMTLYGGMLEACRIMPTSTGNEITKYPTINDTSNMGGYVDEATDDDVSDVAVGNVAFPMTPSLTSKIVKISWELLQDDAIGLEGMLAELLGERIGRYANLQFTSGAVANKIAGFVPNVSSALTSASQSAPTRAELVTLFHGVDPAYRNSARCRWMFNDATLAIIKKMSFGTGDDRPLWVPSMQVGAPDTLDGKPYTINQNMDSFGVSKKPIAFGDFDKYVIRRVNGITLEVTRDLYWASSQNGYKAKTRMDGRLVNTAAIKVMSTPA